MTGPQLHALRWLHANRGVAAIDRYGKVCALNAQGNASHHTPDVWLRLVSFGYLTGSHSELRITAAGIDRLFKIGDQECA